MRCVGQGSGKPRLAPLLVVVVVYEERRRRPLVDLVLFTAVATFEDFPTHKYPRGAGLGVLLCALVVRVLSKTPG